MRSRQMDSFCAAFIAISDVLMISLEVIELRGSVQRSLTNLYNAAHGSVTAVVPGSLLGKALHYMSAQWPKLSRFVNDGTYPIDNNPCENAIRPFVVGRRNWLFSDTVGGVNASANLYSLLQTCKVNGIEPYPIFNMISS